MIGERNQWNFECVATTRLFYGNDTDKCETQIADKDTGEQGCLVDIVCGGRVRGGGWMIGGGELRILWNERDLNLRAHGQRVR